MFYGVSKEKQNAVEAFLEPHHHKAIHSAAYAEAYVELMHVYLNKSFELQQAAAPRSYLDENFGEDQDGYLALTLSREDIANVVGTATESAIRLLSEFKKNGLIALDGKKVKVLNEVGLMRLSQGF